MSSEGAAGASAAVKRRGAASRGAAKQQARAPEEDTLADHTQRCRKKRALLAGRPGHRTAPEQVQVQMIHALTAVL
ncbi:MAG TPA: hypothetical protein VK478_03650, partial [Gemmatimonadaceae bacterium]|nr:hypothetical protein [Gemmatimonadaceae bacterium]